MRLNDKLYIIFLQSLAQFVKLMSRKNDSEMRNRHVVLIDVIAVLLGLEVFFYESDSQQMIVKIVPNSGFRTVYFLGPDDFGVETTGSFQGMRRNSYLELTYTHLQS